MDPKDLQIQLTGFLAKNAREFMAELWKMLIDAEQNAFGIPTALLDSAKEAVLKHQVDAKLLLHCFPS